MFLFSKQSKTMGQSVSSQTTLDNEKITEAESEKQVEKNDFLPLPAGYLTTSTSTSSNPLLTKHNCIQINDYLHKSGRIGVGGSLRKEAVWRLVYSSDRHGKSWAVFQSKLALCEQSIVLFSSSSESGNHDSTDPLPTSTIIFGGFFPLPLTTSVDFKIHADTLLLSSFPPSTAASDHLLPNPVGLFLGSSKSTQSKSNLYMYAPTGINSNHVYFNQGSKSFPNGMGMGGQIDYFAFFVDCDLERGVSRGCPSTTFGNMPVHLSLPKEQFHAGSSGGDEFKVEGIEVWCLLERDQESIEFKRSVRENGEAKAILEMAGIEMHGI